jgi:hypothetical protein
LTYFRLVYNVRDLSDDSTNERERELKDTEINAHENQYAQDILGNTEVDLELNHNGASTARIQINANLTEQINGSMNSVRNNQETNEPQNLITHFANNEMRFNRINMNTENEEDIYTDQIEENFNINATNIDRQATDRYGVNNGFLLNTTLEKKPCDFNVSCKSLICFIGTAN